MELPGAKCDRGETLRKLLFAAEALGRAGELQRSQVSQHTLCLYTLISLQYGQAREGMWVSVCRWRTWTCHSFWQPSVRQTRITSSSQRGCGMTVRLPSCACIAAPKSSSRGVTAQSCINDLAETSARNGRREYWNLPAANIQFERTVPYRERMVGAGGQPVDQQAVARPPEVGHALHAELHAL